jgi:hypothetical protein
MALPEASASRHPRCPQPHWLATHDDAATDAGADGEHEHLIAPPAGPVLLLGPGRGIGIVFHDDLDVEAMPDRFRHIDSLIGKIGGECDMPRRIFDVGGGGDADRGGPRIGTGVAPPTDELVEGQDDRRRPGFGVGGTRRALPDGAVLIDEDSEYLRATDIHPSGQHDPPSIEAVDSVPGRVLSGFPAGFPAGTQVSLQG